MAEIDINAGSKRRLPSWMTGITSVDQLDKPRNEYGNHTSLEEKSLKQTAHKKKKSVGKKLESEVSTCEKEVSEVNSGPLLLTEKAKRCNVVGTDTKKRAGPKKWKLTKYEAESSKENELNVLANEKEAPRTDCGSLVRCQTSNRRKRSKLDQDIDPTIGSSRQTRKTKGRCTEEGRKVQNRTAPRKQKLKNCETESDDDIEAPSSAEGSEDGELTMEDLMSMAEEVCQKSRRKQSRLDLDRTTNSSRQMKKTKRRCMEEGRKAQKRTAPRKQKLKNYGTESGDDIEAPSSTEGSEDGGLTVEDLMGMAEECVETSKKKECQQKRTSEPKSESQFQSRPILSENELGGSLQPSGSVHEMSTGATTECISYLIENERDEKESLAGRDAIAVNRTGDPAQDMLNLFLGPLLKKPQKEEKTLDLLSVNMKIHCNFDKHGESGVAVEHQAPLTKKKSSLKDKVAMFLD